MSRISFQPISLIKAMLVVVVAIQPWAVSAAPFRNLGFDEANTNTTQFFIPSDPSLPRPEGVGPPEDLVPGWQLIYGSNPVSFVGYNLARTNVSWFSLISKGLAPERVEGLYALHLTFVSGPNPWTLLLRQSGDIPADAKTLTFRHDPFEEYIVTADGNRLFPSSPEPSQSPEMTSLDISAFAGKNVELVFVLAGDSGMIDSIAFAGPPLQFIRFVSGDNNLTLSWSAATGPYLIQEKFNLADTNWINVVTTSNTTTTVARVGQASFFRISDHATNSVSQLTVSLTGVAERPNPVATSATGFGRLSIEGNVLTYTINFSDLSGPASAAHIHGPADPEHNADVIIGLNFIAATSGALSGTLDLSTLSADQVNSIRTGNAYLNIHTLAHPDGEIRGQLVP
jgi:hypothetical protein